MPRDPIRDYIEALRAEARDADEHAEGEAGKRLRALADSASDMTPAEKTWAGEATGEDLRQFTKAIRSGCAPDEAR
jgi:hypothetical protein